jgi:hypothetical protein
MNYFYALSFANANDGFAVGNAGTIARTTDAGSTWTLLPPRTANNLYAISVADTNRGIIVGGNGTIIRLTDSGMVATDVRGSALAAPSGFRLEQNYPNPFNPVTKIRFGIGAASSVSLRLYDLLGRQVATLADEELAPGSYERTFDGSKLPSGMYFYRLRAAGHDGRPARVETRKLLLLR